MPDRATLVAMLRESGEAFMASFRNRTPEQLAFRPPGGGWTIAETAEHVILAEVGSGKLLRGRLVREPASPELLAQAADGDERIDARLARRDARFAAPDFVLPTGRWPTAPELVAVFEESRSATIAFLDSTAIDLSRHAYPHPVLGPLTGLQWSYFLVRHCLRHVGQIADIARQPGYPGGA